MSNRQSNWAIGWTAFAAIMMLAMGIWWFIAGLVAIFEDTFFVVTEDYIFKSSTWGWIHRTLPGTNGIRRSDIAASPSAAETPLCNAQAYGIACCRPTDGGSGFGRGKRN